MIDEKRDKNEKNENRLNDENLEKCPKCRPRHPDNSAEIAAIAAIAAVAAGEMLQKLKILHLQLASKCHKSGFHADRLREGLAEMAAMASVPSWILVAVAPSPASRSTPHFHNSTKRSGKGDILENHLVSHGCLHTRSLKVGET